jgi:hypothetical protein
MPVFCMINSPEDGKTFGDANSPNQEKISDPMSDPRSVRKGEPPLSMVESAFWPALLV